MPGRKRPDSMIPTKTHNRCPRAPGGAAAWRLARAGRAGDELIGHYLSADRLPWAVGGRASTRRRSGIWLAQAMAGRRQGLYQLMVYFAAYTGLRWGELAAQTVSQVSAEVRAVAVDRKVIEVRGRLYLEAPKNRKWRQAIYPSLTPQGWPLAEMVAARVGAASAEQDVGTNPLGLMFPAPAGGYWRSSNFRRRVLEDGYRPMPRA